MQHGQPAARVVPINSKSAASVADRAKLERLPSAAHQVREKGKQLLSKSLHQVFDNADDALFTLADKATNNQEQNLYFESMREVRIRRRHMEAKFETAIDQAFIDLLDKKQGDDPSESYLADQNINIDDLSLVKNDDLEELVAVDSMVSKANSSCGESLQFLSMRIDSLVPTKVYQKNNPFGPQVICHSFINTAKDLDADIKAKLVLFKLFDQYVVTQLPAIHEALNHTLVELGVLPSIQQSKSRGGQSGVAAQFAASANAAGTPANVTAAAQDTLNALRGLMHPQSGGGTGPVVVGGQIAGNGIGGGASYSPMQGEELLGALSQLQGQQQTAWHQGGPVVAAPMDVNGFINQLLQSQGGQRQLGGMEADVINLVKMLFEFILDDRNLAAPLKAMIGRLQIPILKVALLDKTFFNKAGHPARRLLNEMATASLGWQEDPNCDGEPQDPLYKKVQAIVYTLLSEFESDVSIFTDMLTDFVAFIDRERRRANILEQRTLDAEDGKAKAEAARRQVKEALHGILQDKSLPASAQKIIDNAWSDVLFLICLREGASSDTWRDALQTADDLIWSVTVPVDQEARSQLLGMIPRIVRNLRNGLEKISFNPFELTQLLGQLEKLHMQRLRGVEKPAETQADGGEKSAPQAKIKSLVAVTSPPQQSQTRKDTVAANQDSNQETNKAPVTELKSTAAKEKPAPEASKKTAPSKAVIDTEHSTLVSAEDAKAIETIDESYLALVGKLTQGSWFEMDDGKHQYRCRLAAIIKATGKFIFVNRNGMKVAEESRETLAVAMKNGSLRLLDDSMLFDRALESVIGSLRNTRSG